MRAQIIGIYDSLEAAQQASAAFLLPGGGHLYMAGHLARTALHAMGVAAKGAAA